MKELLDSIDILLHAVMGGHIMVRTPDGQRVLDKLRAEYFKIIKESGTTHAS